MPSARHRRAQHLLCPLALCAFAIPPAQAQNANSPAPSPAGIQAPDPAATPKTAPPRPVSVKDKRDADDAYLAGARQVDRREYEAAEKNFARAYALNPNDTDYLRALAFAREARITALVRDAATARQSGDRTHAAALLQQAHQLDPDNRIVAEHLSSGADALSPVFDPLKFPPANIASLLDGPVELTPTAGKQSFHERGDGQSVLRTVYQRFGIRTQFDASVTTTPNIRFDLDDVTFDQATALLHQITKTFAVAVQPTVALIAKDTSEDRDRLVPQLEETIYLPGYTNDQMQELANVARNIYEVKNVTASGTAGTILLRADEPTLKLVNAQYAQMVDGNSDVLLEIKLYEIDQSKIRNVGVTLPTGLSVFALATTLQNAINANQSLIAAAVSSGNLVLTGDPAVDIPVEIAFLAGAGVLSSSQLALVSGFIGTIGRYNNFPLAGVSISSGATVNALLQASDARILDSVQIRSSNNQPANFRSGTRYPIVTSTYTSGVSSSLLSGASSAIQNAVSQYLGTGSSVTVPQIQFEDLGLTIKATPHIHRDNEVGLQLDMKIEALGAGSLNGIPLLNNRQFTSTVTVPEGQTALLLSEVNRSEIGSVQGFPGLSELPGFSGPEHDMNKATDELLISITPHVVRQEKMHVASRRLSVPRNGPSD